MAEAWKPLPFDEAIRFFERRVPMTRMRTRIAERMMESKNSIAMLTSFNEVNLAAVSRLRKEHGFTRDPRKKFGIEAVFSTEPLRFPAVDACDVAHPGAASAPQGLACAGYGSSMAVTASVGLLCAARALEHLLRQAEAPARVAIPESSA